MNISTHNAVLESDFEGLIATEYYDLSKKYKIQIADFMRGLYKQNIQYCNINDITDFLQDLECKKQRDIFIIENLCEELWSGDYMILDCNGLFSNNL